MDLSLRQPFCLRRFEGLWPLILLSECGSKKVVVNLAFPCYDKAPPCLIGVALQASQ
jgi:hypothetical protein